MSGAYGLTQAHGAAEPDMEDLQHHEHAHIITTSRSLLGTATKGLMVVGLPAMLAFVGTA